MRSGGKEERGGESRKQLSIEESGRPSFDYYKEKEIDIPLSTYPTPFLGSSWSINQRQHPASAEAIISRSADCETRLAPTHTGP